MVFHDAHYLMPKDHWQMGRRGATFDLVQFRVTDATTCDTEQEFTFVLFWLGYFFQRKWNGILFERGDLS
jgi:hypothetical protein